MHASLSTLGVPLLVLALLIVGAAGWWWLSRQPVSPLLPSAEAPRTVASTVQGSTVTPVSSTGQPQAALVLGSVERKAYRLLRDAFPRAEVLAHVQLLRFIRLPPREQRESWLHGVGMLDTDLLLCDGRFRVLAAVDVRTHRDTPAGIARNERMAQVLQAAGITVHVWHEDALPSVADIRATVAPALAARKARARAAEAKGLGLQPPANGALPKASRLPAVTGEADETDEAGVTTPLVLQPEPRAPAGLAPPSAVPAKPYAAERSNPNGRAASP